MSPPRGSLDMGLTGRPCAALLGICLLTGAMLASGATGRVWFSADPPVHTQRVESARERIDPNTASAASLRRLGGIGPARANAILKARRAHEPGAFVTPDDLATKVRGIGPATVARIAPHLDLPDYTPPPDPRREP